MLFADDELSLGNSRVMLDSIPASAVSAAARQQTERASTATCILEDASVSNVLTTSLKSVDSDCTRAHLCPLLSLPIDEGCCQVGVLSQSRSGGI